MFSRSRYDEVRREIEAILDDPTLPRYLQVSRIIDLFDTTGGTNMVDWFPDETQPSSRYPRAEVTADSRLPHKSTRKKRAKATKRRT